MTLELNEDSLGDPRNAQLLAIAAELSYCPEDEGRQRYLAELGLQARLISVGNTQAYVATDDNNVVVAFRGTESPTSLEGLKDWLLTDAMSLLIVPEGRLGTDLAAAGVGARFHQGFVNAIGDIWDRVGSTVEAELNDSERPLWITGHSLGGALALLAAWLFTRRTIAVHEIVTFGAPMIGNRLAVAAFNNEFAGRIFRYVNTPDPVPRLPMYSLTANEFTHCDRECRLSSDSDDPLSGFLQSISRNAAQTLLNSTVVDELWSAVQGSVAAHGMDHYRRLIG